MPAEFLNYLRVREWQDLDSQLRQVVPTLGIATAGDDGARRDDPQRVHRSLLAGLLSHIGLRDPRSASTSARAARTFAPSRARRCSRSRRAG